MSRPPRATPSSPTSEALRLAQRAWKLLHIDSARAIALADQALARAQARGDAAGESWARLARGIHLLYLLKRADDELLVAKREGRNRVLAAS